jgi:hypothetical protein
MTPKYRANILYNKYSKQYNRFVVSGYIKQGLDEWKEIAIELGKLYEAKERAKNYMRLKEGYKDEKI